MSCLFVLAAFTVKDSYGIPAFSRKYQTSCMTCHYAFPMLNAFGKAFMNNGFRWPGGDSNYVKEEPVSLGADGNKKAFPNAVWPSDIPGTSPISFYLTGLFNYKAMSDTAKWDFNIPNYLNIMYGGTLGNSFSFFGETEFEKEYNALYFDFSAFIQWDLYPELHIKAGEVRADPTFRELKLTTNNYNIEDLTSRNGWSFSNTQFGFELSGALNGIGNHGGLTYRIGVVNGQGITQTNPPKGSCGHVACHSNHNTGKPTKDFCGKVTYKFGGLSETGETKTGETKTGETKEVKSREEKPYKDNSLTLGGYFYKGTESGNANEKLTVLGGDIDIWYDRFIINSSLMYMNSDMPDTVNQSATSTRKSLAYYVQTNGVIFPWLIALVRYEWTRADLHGGYQPVISVIPGITILPRANIKINLEGKKYLDNLDSKNNSFNLRISFAM